MIPYFNEFAEEVFWKLCGIRRNCLDRAMPPFPPRVSYPDEELSAIFIKFEIVVCIPFSFWKSLKFVIWESINLLISGF